MKCEAGPAGPVLTRDGERQKVAREALAGVFQVCLLARPDAGEGAGGIRGAQMSRLFAALFETGGQFAYVYAMSRNGIAAAPVVASYCVMSLILGVLFLKERLSFKQYIAIGLVIAGIITLGVLEGLSGAGEAAEKAAGEIAEIAALGSFPLC